MSSSLKSEECSGQLQHVAIDDLISHGFDAEDVKKLKDARIVTCNDLMMHTEKNFKDLTKDKVDQIREAVEKLGDFLKTFVNLPGIEVLHEAKADQIREAAEELVNLGRVNGPKFNQICEAAKKLLDYLKTFVDDSIDREVIVLYKDYAETISAAVKQAIENNYKEPIVFKLNNGETLEQGPMKAIMMKIQNSNKCFERNDEFKLKYLVNLKEKVKKGKQEHDKIHLY